jgi:hypothetical protein
MTPPILPFFANADGNPIRSKLRMAWQALPEVPATTGWFDGLTDGGKLAGAPTAIDQKAITPSSSKLPSLPGHDDIKEAVLTFGDVDPGGKFLLMVLGNFLQGYRTDSPAAGSFLHRLGQAQLATAEAPRQLTLLHDQATGEVLRFCDGRIKGWTLNASKGQNLELNPVFVVGKRDLWGDPAQITGAGSTLPILRHDCSLQWLPDATDGDLFVKLTTVTGGAPAGIKVHSTAAGTFVGAEIPVTPGIWTYLTDQTNSPIGPRRQQVQIYFPVGGTYVANDVFQFPKRRGTFVQSLNVRRPIPEVNLRLYIGGLQFRMEGGYSITATIPGVTRRDGAGEEQAYGTIRTGQWDLSITLTRRLVDLTLQSMLLQRLPAQLVIEAISDTLIPTTTVPYGLALVMPNVLFQGEGYGVEAGGAKQDETFKGDIRQADAGGGVTYGMPGCTPETWTDDITALVTTDIATV